MKRKNIRLVVGRTRSLITAWRAGRISFVVTTFACWSFGELVDPSPAVAVNSKSTIGVVRQDAGNSRAVATETDDHRKLFDVSAAMNQWDQRTRNAVDQAIVQAYVDSVAYGSSDRVLIEEELRQQFLETVKSRLRAVDQTIRPPNDAVLVWRLLSLRKRGGLPKQTGQAKRPEQVKSTLGEKIQAEIASRRSEEWFDATLDRVLVDAKGRRFFDEVVQQLQSHDEENADESEADAVLRQDRIRRNALALRKARRLRPELSARLVDWEIQQLSFPASQLVNDISQVPQQPGIYLFRDSSGYLYIGEAIDLRERMQQHLSESDRKQLAAYLEQQNLEQIQIDFHVFPNDSPGKKLNVRRAYESELIRSRKPRFNIRP